MPFEAYPKESYHSLISYTQLRCNDILGDQNFFAGVSGRAGERMGMHIWGVRTLRVDT